VLFFCWKVYGRCILLMYFVIFFVISLVLFTFYKKVFIFVATFLFMNLSLQLVRRFSSTRGTKKPNNVLPSAFGNIFFLFYEEKTH